MSNWRAWQLKGFATREHLIEKNTFAKSTAPTMEAGFCKGFGASSSSIRPSRVRILEVVVVVVVFPTPLGFGWESRNAL
jgi:hypothetical protein